MKIFGRKWNFSTQCIFCRSRRDAWIGYFNSEFCKLKSLLENFKVHSKFISKKNRKRPLVSLWWHLLEWLIWSLNGFNRCSRFYCCALNTNSGSYMLTNISGSYEPFWRCYRSETEGFLSIFSNFEHFLKLS